MEKARTITTARLAMIPETGVMKPKQVAFMLGVCLSQVYEMNNDGSLVARFHLFDSEKGLRWHIDDVNDFLEKRQSGQYVEQQKQRSMNALQLLKTNQEKNVRPRYGSAKR